MYRRYLQDAVAAAFICEVAQRYTIATLERLAGQGTRQTRRAATLALGFLGDFRSNDVLGKRLRDPDRGVRLLADSGLRELWFRDGDESQQLELRKIRRLNRNGMFMDAIDEADQLIGDAPWFAEIWNQRAIAKFRLGFYRDSIPDGRTALELNPYHFPAAVDLGECYLRLENAAVAYECFSLATELNPDLVRVRAQIASLRRKLKRG
jgi:tetratricopeptide (TPR) repeat protein